MSTQRFIETVQRIDFSAVGATGLLPLDIKYAVVKEKLSVMLYAKYFSQQTQRPVLKHSEFVHQPSSGNPSKNIQQYLTVTEGGKKYYASLTTHPFIVFNEVYILKKNEFKYDYTPPVCISIKPGAKPGEISVFDLLRKFDSCPDSTRIEELLKLFHIGGHTYSPFRFGGVFSPQQFPDALPVNHNADGKAFGEFQRDLERWYKGGFPRRYQIINEKMVKPYGAEDVYVPEYENDPKAPKTIKLPAPIFYGPIGPMVYDIREDDTLQETRLYRLFFNYGCGLREALIPACYIRGDGFCDAIMTGLPGMERLPLWNLQRVMSPTTDTVVLCCCIQDAEALQRDNAYFENVAFTSYVDVGDNLELVDFSPLAEKNVVFFISNHNGGTLEDAYEEIAGVFEFIRKKGIKIKDCEFVQREVQYPCDTLTIATPEDLASAYSNSQPAIVPDSSLIMDETDFFTFLAKIRKERETPPFWAPAEQGPVKDNPAKGILIRSLLYRNAITVLAGPPAAGKSRFCRSLIRYLVKGNDRKYMIERFWTRCCSGSTMKILYWNFDCIHDLETWKKICLRGLSEDQKENIFIENAPTEEDFFDKAYGRPDVGAYRRKLVKYTNKGTLGHPLDLLIVDTLVSVWNKKNIEGSLQFLNQLIKAVPGMAVLAIHHTTDLGKPLGGGDPKRIPRIVMTMERINRKVKLDSSGKQSTKKEKTEKKTVTSIYKFRYDKFSTSHADVEDLPFYCVREDEDMYSVYKPVCPRDEMFSSIVYHYRKNDDDHPTNKVIGAILGYSNREVQKRMIDEKTYLAILNNAEKKAKKNNEPAPKPKKQSKA